MDYAQEQKIKHLAEQQAKFPEGTTTPMGPAGQIGNDRGMHEGLRSRLAGRLGRAREEQHRREAMEELAYLLEKNQEVARIIELVEQIGL